METDILQLHKKCRCVRRYYASAPLRRKRTLALLARGRVGSFHFSFGLLEKGVVPPLPPSPPSPRWGAGGFICRPLAGGSLRAIEGCPSILAESSLKSAKIPKKRTIAGKFCAKDSLFPQSPPPPSFPEGKEGAPSLRHRCGGDGGCSEALPAATNSGFARFLSL